MKVVCIATSRNKMLEHWESSAKQWGYEFEVIGEGTVWKGFQTFTTLLLQYLNSQEFKNKLIALVDAYDVVFTGPPEELKKKYESFNSPIVVGGENECIMNCYKHSCDVNNEEYRYVNTGFVMGPINSMIQLFEYTLKHSPNDDQIGVAKYMSENCNIVSLDGNQEIVANLRDVKNIKPIDGKRFRHMKTNTVPVMIHTPFMYMDMGRRADLVKKHILDDYVSPGKMFYLNGYVKHVWKHSTNNPAYAPLWVVCIGTPILLVIIIVLICHLKKK